MKKKRLNEVTSELFTMGDKMVSATFQFGWTKITLGFNSVPSIQELSLFQKILGQVGSSNLTLLVDLSELDLDKHEMDILEIYNEEAQELKQEVIRNLTSATLREVIETDGRYRISFNGFLDSYYILDEGFYIFEINKFFYEIMDKYFDLTNVDRIR